VQGTAGDNTRSSEAAKVASPSISGVLAAYLADEKQRLSAKIYGQYADVIDLLQHSLNRYAANSLDKGKYALWEQHFDAEGAHHGEFCDIFGPEHILPNVGEFLNYFMIRKVMAGQDLMRASGTVTKKLAKWLAAKGYATADEAGDAVERGAAAARDLPRAEKLAALLYQFTSSKYFPEDSDIEDQFEIKRVEPGKVWLESFDDGRLLGPISLPAEATKLCQVGWNLSGAVRRRGKTWLLVEAWTVYP
jgi:hypothetical protein